MIIPVAALCAVLLPVVLGGSLRRLAGVRLHLPWVVGAALLLQIVVIEVFTRPAWLLGGVHVLTYLAAALFIWINRRVPGLVLIGLGGLSNGVAIALNGGTLPASAEALHRAGVVQTTGEFVNSGHLEAARLAFLGDVFAIPADWPLANVFSIGDVWIVLGVGFASMRICGTRWSAPWTPRAGGHRPPRHSGREVRAGRHVMSAPVASSPVAVAVAVASPTAVAGGEGDASGRPHLPRQRRRELREEARPHAGLHRR